MKLGILLLSSALCWAQTAPPLEQGRAMYRGNCAFCHGLDGKGGRGPDLVSAPLAHGDSDADIAKVVRGGVPGSSMPAFSETSDEEVKNVILYLRQLSGGAPRKPVQIGDPAAGKLVYERNGCASCHLVGNRGSVYGPDLSRIGVARSLDYLRASIVNPSADIPQEYEAVTAVPRTGAAVSGIRINEDAFTLQLRGPSQRFRSFNKSALKQVIRPNVSAMPAYARLKAADLDNLLGYLLTLRGSASGETKAAEGIH